MDTKQITLRLPIEVAERLRVRAQTDGVSVNAFIMLLIAKELNLVK